MKFPPVHPIAARAELIAEVPLVFDIYPGITYVIAVRGDLTGSTITAKSLIRDAETGDDVVGSEREMDTFDATKEGTFVTTGDRLILERAHADPETAPALIVTLINVALSPLA